ncbi:MAG: asparagine synthase (glutamine-hydrolyzing) [Desulfobacteraceae bacterium]|nr:asparagine synthase (glutamine-hydrolyzing) [Desulfobacteraceae bacterium]
MCGICGYFSYKSLIKNETLELMNNQMIHRGPDDSGIINFTKNEPFCGLGHRRLSIIDLSGGRQPMTNEDETIWIAYNGEIYNHEELRKDLQARGHVYKTRSDTETIIHLYEEYGEDCVKFLRGMFAFAIADTKKKTLFLARDRLGIKPLYYADTGSGFVFGSEIKSVLKSGWIDPGIYYPAIPEYFAFGYVTNEWSMFDGIKKLLPGQYMVVSEKGIDTKVYWEIKYDDRLKGYSLDDVKEHLRELFEESVRLRLMSDVPLGVFLSGGIDSSAIAYSMSRHMNEPLKAFTIGFEKPYYSEAPYAKEVAKSIGAKLYEVVLKPHDFINSIEKLIHHEDKPVTWPSGVALYFIAKKAKHEVKVVLTGEGGDELFGGYDKYWVTRWHIKYGKYVDAFIPDRLRENLIKKHLWDMPVPLKIKKLTSHTLFYHRMNLDQIFFDNFYSTFALYQQRSLFSDTASEIIGQSSPYKRSAEHFQGSQAPNILEKLLYTDIKTYLVQLLMKQDKMSMAASIESRVPYLDHKLVEFAANVPPEYKIKGTDVKYIVKETMKNMLPDSIIKRPKMGFPTPIQTWLKEPEFNNYAKEILFDTRTGKRDFYNMETVTKIFNDHVQGKMDNSGRLWYLINFEIWNRIYFD